ncbi:MAG: hypothetical protein JXA03_06980 [Bacteroidales bacterium]|nr:hypothetical protein [Bacteroidales bacterium]
MKKYLLLFVIVLFAGIRGAPQAILAGGRAEIAPQKTGPEVLARISLSDATWDIQMNYNASAGGEGQYGAETDGSSLFTTNWNDNYIHKFSKNGLWIESFTIGSVTQLKDLAYDGTYFYGGKSTNLIYKMNFTTKTLVSTITAPTGTVVRGIAWDPVNSGFWVCDWASDIKCISTTGTLLATIPATNHMLTSIAGLAYDSYSAGGPFLWAFDQGGNGCNLIRLSLPDGIPTGVFHDVKLDVGASLPSPQAGGLFIQEGVLPGIVTIGGLLQNTPNTFFGYELTTYGAPVSNDLGVQFVLTPNSAANLTNQETVKVKIRNYGTAAQSNFPVSYKVNGGSPVTQNVSASLAGGATMEFTFTQKANLGWSGRIYSIEAYTSLANDQRLANNSVTKEVFHYATTNQNVIAAEYFINADPGQGNGTAITGGMNQYEVTLYVNNLSLPVGSKVYVRVKSSDGYWSSPVCFRRMKYFSNMGSTLAYAEYFIGSDPGQGNGTALTISNGEVSIPNLNLAPGQRMYIRVKDNFNRWSNPFGYKRPAYLGASGSTLVYGEYFINTDPGQGSATPVAIVNGTMSLPNFDLPAGHRVYFRVKDNCGRWSSPNGFKRPSDAGNSGATLVYGEYFINTDPGQGSATPVSIAGGQVSLPNLHLNRNDRLYLRVKDSYNRWSVPTCYKHRYLNMQKAEYRIRLASSGQFTTPELLTLSAPSDTTPSFAAFKNNVTWHANDSIFVRYFTQYGIPSSWKKGMVTFASPDVTVCQGQPAVLTANGGPNYLWSTGQTTSSVTVSPEATTAYWVKVWNAEGASSTDTVIVFVDPLPVGGGPVSGPGEACKNTGPYIYTVVPIPNALTYNWVLPAGASGSSQTNSIAVVYGANAQSGMIKVRGQNACGYGPFIQFPVTVNASVPGVPGAISGPTVVCTGTSPVTYTVPVISNATSYIWTLPAGAGGSSTTNSISVTFGAGSTSGNITVKGQNSCGEGPSSTLAVTVNSIPVSAGAISGNNTVCQGQSNIQYTVPAIQGASSYSWTLPQGATGSSATNSIAVNFGYAAVSGNITVFGTNTCGNGAPSSLAVTVNPLPGAAGAITGNTTVCQGTSNTYSVPAIANATGYTWSLPAGATGSSSSNTILVNFGSNASSGNISVNGVNGCGNGTVSSLAVTVNPLPAAAGVITGNSYVCQGTGGTVYSVPVIANATSYSWTLPAGASGSSATNSITVNFGAGASSGNITVKGVNGCGNGAASSMSITVGATPGAAGNISGLSTICQGQSNITYSVPPITNATDYVWTLPPGATGNSNTHVISLSFGSSSYTGYLTVKGVNACGEGASSSYHITVNPVPGAAGTISGPVNVFPGQTGAIYFVNPVNYATSYYWSLPPGASIVAGNNTNLITVDFSPAAQSGGMTVYGINGCGTGAVSPALQVNVFTTASVSLKAFLEGPYNGSAMSTFLNSNNIIPLSQPFNQAPWNYTGTESVSSIPGNDITDWALVELRDAATATQATAATVIYEHAVFIRNDGKIVDLDGSETLSLPVAVNENLFAVIWHRNHLGIMSANPLQLTGNTWTYDFTTGIMQVYGGGSGHKLIAPGVWGMISADGNADKQVNNADKNDVWKVQAGSSGYLAGDFDMNGQVDNPDKNDEWIPNSGSGSQVPDNLIPPGGYQCQVP